MSFLSRLHLNQADSHMQFHIFKNTSNTVLSFFFPFSENTQQNKYDCRVLIW